jgi:hypothetical protein
MDESEFEAIKEMLDKKDKLLDTTELVHSEAYDKVVRKLLMDDKGKVDYGKLKKSGMQKKFADELKDHYLEAARDALGISDDSKGELEDEMLIKAYTGVTSNYFREQLSTKKHQYTKGEHSGVVTKLKGAQDEELTPIAFRKIKEEHISDIIDHMGARDYIDKDKIRLPEAINLLNIHYKVGVTEKGVEGHLYHKKKAA